VLASGNLGIRSFSSGSSNQSTSPALASPASPHIHQQHLGQRITSFTGHRGLQAHTSLLLSLIFPFSHDKYARCILTSQLSSSHHLSLSRISDQVPVYSIERRRSARSHYNLQPTTLAYYHTIPLSSISPHRSTKTTPKSLLSLSTPNAVLRTTSAKRTASGHSLTEN
jgi:hypothetical protein